jgi:hypothetical protein
MYPSTTSLSKIQHLKHKYKATRAQFLRKEEGHNPPKIKGFYHQRISVVELDTSLKSFEILI